MRGESTDSSWSGGASFDPSIRSEGTVALGRQISDFRCPLRGPVNHYVNHHVNQWM
jgi:hypothetical protein